MTGLAPTGSALRARVGRPRAGRALLTVLTLIALLCLASCTPATPPGYLATLADLSDQSYVVGSKNFDEQLVLCQLTIAALESAGASVTDSCNTGTTNQTRQALVDDEIDMYWEYNGTGWTNHLHRTNPSHDSTALYNDTRTLDLAENHIVWLAPTDMSNSYAFAINKDLARRLNVATLSDMARVLRAGTPEATVCLEPEFDSRPEGWIPMQQVYGFKAPLGPRVSVRDLNDIYPAVAVSRPCSFGEVYASDGRVDRLGLTVLRDDRNFIPAYNASLTMSEKVYNDNPTIANVIKPITDALDIEEMKKLNALVTVDKRDPKAVAREWLRTRRFIG